MKRALSGRGVAVFLVFLVIGMVRPGWSETLKVGGTGSSAPIVTRLFDAFSKQAPGVSLDQVSPPLGSGGAMKALAKGSLDLAFSGRSPTPEERTRIGNSFELAVTPFVFVSAGGQKKNGFTLDELATVFDGSQTTWDGGVPIRLVLRASFESDTLVMKSMSPAMAKAVDVAGKRPGMVIGQDDLDTLALLKQTPGSFGPTTLALVDERLTVFAIQGVTPSLATIQDGSYAWRKVLTVVVPPQPKPVVTQFVDFLHSKEAKAVLLSHHYLPLDP
ncbi:MAG: substrate-binding domain-containing protein [Magnetococcales bacterium]|nr:substrate-binding domain-containing protein [Magnetococcales bacterium]